MSSKRYYVHGTTRTLQGIRSDRIQIDLNAIHNLIVPLFDYEFSIQLFEHDHGNRYNDSTGHICRPPRPSRVVDRAGSRLRRGLISGPNAQQRIVLWTLLDHRLHQHLHSKLPIEEPAPSIYQSGTDTSGLEDDNADALICRLCCVVDDDFVEELLDPDLQPQHPFIGSMAIAGDTPDPPPSKPAKQAATKPKPVKPAAMKPRRRYTKGKPRKYFKGNQIAAELWHQQLSHGGIEKLKHTGNCTTGMEDFDKAHPLFKCQSCQMAKMMKAAKSKIDNRPASRKGERFHMDFGFFRGPKHLQDLTKRNRIGDLGLTKRKNQAPDY